MSVLVPNLPVLLEPCFICFAVRDRMRHTNCQLNQIPLGIIKNDLKESFFPTVERFLKHRRQSADEIFSDVAEPPVGNGLKS